MHLWLEETFSEGALPTSVPDYTLYTHDGKALGCIDAKASGEILPLSIAQGMLQLISLHEKAPHTLFNVITDA